MCPSEKDAEDSVPGDLPGWRASGSKEKEQSSRRTWSNPEEGQGTWGRTRKSAMLWEERHFEGQTALSISPSPRGGTVWKVRAGTGEVAAQASAQAPPAGPGDASAESVLATGPSPGVMGLGCLLDRVQEHGQPRLQHLSARSDLLSARRRGQRVPDFRCGRGRPRAAAPLPAALSPALPGLGDTAPAVGWRSLPHGAPRPVHLLVPGAATRGAIAASPGRPAGVRAPEGGSVLARAPARGSV